MIERRCSLRAARACASRAMARATAASGAARRLDLLCARRPPPPSLGGFFPALRAARISPIQAMRG
ncbi:MULTISPECIES: hypothetical protein [Sorangium]|uniref:hypothetical protein n=1 Tax=Sorangium TaxID=39643 RepID=UPI003D9C0383